MEFLIQKSNMTHVKEMRIKAVSAAAVRKIDPGNNPIVVI
jgi:hypothetical protein